MNDLLYALQHILDVVDANPQAEASEVLNAIEWDKIRETVQNFEPGEDNA